jgi:hypothetical protein
MNMVDSTFMEEKRAPEPLEQPARAAGGGFVLRDRFLQAATFEEFLQHATANRELWQAIWRRAAVPELLLQRVQRLCGDWRLLVLLEDWCGDAVNVIPYVAALAQAAPNLELRVLARDANPDLMDTHLTRGSRSIPVVMLLDAQYREVAWWGPRPAEVQGWFWRCGRKLPKEERYREIRRWYARDRGVTTLMEIVRMIADAAWTRQAA